MVICSSSVLGYFLQFNGLIGCIEQYDLPFLYLRKTHLFGSLQHSPQLLHCPCLFFATGSIEVIVLLSFALQVFFSSFMLVSARLVLFFLVVL